MHAGKQPAVFAMRFGDHGWLWQHGNRTHQWESVSRVSWQLGRWLPMWHGGATALHWASALSFLKYRCWTWCPVDSCMPLQLLSHVWLFVTTWTVGLQVSLSVGFSRRECWSGLPFPFPGDLPDPGTEPASPASAGGFLTTEPPGKRFCKIVALQTCSAPLLLRMLGCSKTKVIYDSSYLEFNTSRISSCPCECSLACEEKKVT